MKEGYEWYLNIQTRRPPWAKIIWTNLATPRHSFIAWILMQGKVPVNTTIARYSTGVTTGCDMCNEGEETQEHLFFECKYAKNIWGNITSWIGIQGTTTSLKEWCEHMLHSRLPRIHREIIYSMFAAAIYHIWRARNELKYKGGTKRMEDNCIQHQRAHKIKNIVPRIENEKI